MAGRRLQNTYLTDSAVKARWIKEGHCHFCIRMCESQMELSNHLEQRDEDDCALYYFRHYKTKVSMNSYFNDIGIWIDDSENRNKPVK